MKVILMICNCFTCPLGKDCYEQRLKLYESLDEEPDYNEIAYSIWCDKTGSKCGWYGFCDEAFTDNIKQSVTKPSNKRHKHTKRIRDSNYDRKIHKLITYDSYKCPYYISNDRVIRCNWAWRSKRFYKRYASKKVRKYNGYISNGSNYKKIFDYWWEVD